MADDASPIGIGHFDEDGNACLTLHLCGVRHDPPSVEVEGIIDTGFTGFIQLPLNWGMALALPLEGTITVTLADGSKRAVLTAMAEATLLGRTQLGVVQLSPSSEEVLIGMDFLRRFERALVVSRKLGVVLVEEDAL